MLVSVKIKRNYDLSSRKSQLKEAKSVAMNIFRKKYFLFKSFIKIGLSYAFIINMFSTSEKCMEK